MPRPQAAPQSGVKPARAGNEQQHLQPIVPSIHGPTAEPPIFDVAPAMIPVATKASPSGNSRQKRSPQYLSILRVYRASLADFGRRSGNPAPRREPTAVATASRRARAAIDAMMAELAHDIERFAIARAPCWSTYQAPRAPRRPCLKEYVSDVKLLPEEAFCKSCARADSCRCPSAQ